MNKLKQTLEKALKSEPAFFDSESGELNYTKVKDSADKIDEKLISLLADNKELKNKFFTIMDVPFGATVTSCEIILLPSIFICVATSSSAVLVCISTWAIAAMEAKASPLKPLVFKLNKSSACFIFEVA